MSNPVISVENLTKRFNLGVINTGTLTRDLNTWWARIRGKPDPYINVMSTEYGRQFNGSIIALNNVNFTVEEGEALGIIGRNGAGKSTLLKILSQITAPTNGIVKVKGRIGSLLEVGTGFHPALTGRENVYLNGAILGMRKTEVDRKFDEIVDFSGVEKFIDTPVKRYSSGMYVRLAFAVAAHLDPEILIVDEVLAVGDAEFQKKCLGKMGNIASKGRTVLFVSHNMESIHSLCSKVIVLENGSVSYQGSPNQAIDYYLSSINNNNLHISERNDWTGNGGIQVMDYWFEDAHENKLLNPVSGQSLTINLSYEAAKLFRNVNVELEFFSSRGESLTLMASPMTCEPFESIPQKGVFKFIINKLPLTKGNYQITFSAYDNFGVLYRLENAFSFEIIRGDYFGRGNFDRLDDKLFFLDHQIEVIRIA